MNPDVRFLTAPKLIGAWLVSMGVKGWEINESGLVNVAGNVILKGRLGLLTKLPVRFGKVGGFFDCRCNQLVSLDGVPNQVGGDFYCSYNQIVSLEGAPKAVGGYFVCDHNLLVDFKGLEGASIEMDLIVTDPVFIPGNDNALESLDGLPKELYAKVVGLDMQAMFELEKRRAASPLANQMVEELSSEVELG